MSESSQQLALKKGAPGDRCEICFVMCAFSQLPGWEPTDVDDTQAIDIM